MEKLDGKGLDGMGWDDDSLRLLLTTTRNCMYSHSE